MVEAKGAGLVAASASEQLGGPRSRACPAGPVSYVKSQHDPGVGVEFRYLASRKRTPPHSLPGQRVAQGLNAAGAARRGTSSPRSGTGRVSSERDQNQSSDWLGTGDLSPSRRRWPGPQSPQQPTRRGAARRWGPRRLATPSAGRPGHRSTGNRSIAGRRDRCLRAQSSAPCERDATLCARLIEGELPLDDWVAIVRTTIPHAARRRPYRAQQRVVAPASATGSGRFFQPADEAPRSITRSLLEIKAAVDSGVGAHTNNRRRGQWLSNLS